MTEAPKSTKTPTENPPAPKVEGHVSPQIDKGKAGALPEQLIAQKQQQSSGQGSGQS